jgi:flavin-dependent dehydrogenase
MNPPAGNDGDFDVIVIGGAMSGAATAFLLKRRDPSLRILVVEKNTAFKRRVGEATTEVSSFFLTRVLGLTNFLARTQISKNGLRFWFYREGSGTLADCSELGGKYLSTVPAYLIDRSVLDEEMLRRAVATGAELLRPAQVKSVTLREGGQQEVVLSCDGIEKTLRARWVVDASGLKAELARANGWIRPNTDHPTLAVWSRWRNTGDWDGLDTGDADWGRGFYGIRGTATNHFVGEGWWAWWIQLQGGEVSIGAVIDQRLADWEKCEASVGEKLRSFLSRHPAARELLKDAEFVEGDVHFRRNLPYCSEKFAGDGFALVGDASAFLDPLYSPGMDWIAYTISATVALVSKSREGEELAPLIQKHNQDFRVSYERMFGALYRDKYEYLGDHDLMRVAFRLDIASYYLYVVRFLFQTGPQMLEIPPFSPWQAGPFFRLMALYNSRLAAMARTRRNRGEFGKNNQGRRDLVPGFNFRLGQLFRTVLEGFGLWISLELSEGWRSWFRPAGKTTAESQLVSPVPRPAAAHL